MKLTKTILSRTMWMARGTATAFGLALMLAVVLGVGTTALAAVPGDPFRLGQLNVVDGATTLLSGNNPNSNTLSVVNNSAQGNARALDLSVAQGKAPLVVSGNAGTATFLSADRLDGKDSTAFANGTFGKANDANLLDGKDSKDFVPTKTYLVEGLSTNSQGGGTTTFVSANCKPGDRVLSGGPQNVTSGEEEVLDDFPFVSSLDPSQQSWNVKYRDPGAPGDIIALALCADVP